MAGVNMSLNFFGGDLDFDTSCFIGGADNVLHSVILPLSINLNTPGVGCTRMRGENLSLRVDCGNGVHSLRCSMKTGMSFLRGRVGGLDDNVGRRIVSVNYCNNMAVGHVNRPVDTLCNCGASKIVAASRRTGGCGSVKRNGTGINHLGCGSLSKGNIVSKGSEAVLKDFVPGTATNVALSTS